MMSTTCMNMSRVQIPGAHNAPSGKTRAVLSGRRMHTPSGRCTRAAKFSTTSSAATTEIDASIASAREVLISAAETKASDGDAVVDALLTLEKSMRAKAKQDEAVSEETLAQLNGAWRLVFTTGTIDTQKKFGRRINYFPIKAAQCFNTSNMRLTNGIFIGDFAVLKFSGPFQWNMASRKLEFDFTSIAVLGLKFDIGAGKAAEIGASTGLGSNNNKKLVDGGKKPFFNWVSADADIATAR
eukprot:CAMPEP_0118932456 /NCGR_PEP_ID=MMETSP1169-20130426/10283_1 /TAXON_ID=36882 /ORGANISM="Pyramimonas obovata, Strain CCMP722" /LENGTH=240 /DNA_ID=CAMNT_0006875119 /DNA_START=38 /DNA_END=757 /DNA_ORIENTATION=+